LNLRGIKARPLDIDAMMAHGPSLVEMHCSVDDLEWEPKVARDVGLAVHLPEYHKGHLIDPASLNESERQATADIYSHAVERAASWALFFKGEAKIVFHPGGMSVRGLSLKDAARARLQLDKTISAMQCAALGNVEILIENVPRHCWFFGGEWLAGLGTRPEEIESICKDNGLKMTLDLCHLYLASQAEKFDMDEAVARLKPLVRHIHYSGAKGVDGEGLAIDDPEGEFLAAAALAGLADVDATAVPEIWFGHEKNGAGFVEAWRAVESSNAWRGR